MLWLKPNDSALEHLELVILVLVIFSLVPFTGLPFLMCIRTLGPFQSASYGE